jgi:uncharacterized protein YdbL (DUF1318 family)
MKTTLVFRLVFLLAAAGFGAAIVRAEDQDAVKARMAQRLSAVDALRDRQMAGENNRGYLEARGTVSGAEQKIISDENADRRQVYQALAAATKSDPDTVGRQRAQHLAMRSKSGVWVQNASGEWAQKH